MGAMHVWSNRSNAELHKLLLLAYGRQLEAQNSGLYGIFGLTSNNQTSQPEISSQWAFKWENHMWIYVFFFFHCNVWWTTRVSSLPFPHLVGGLPVRMFFIQPFRLMVASTYWSYCLELLCPTTQYGGSHAWQACILGVYFAEYHGFHHKDPRFWKIHFHSASMATQPGARVRRQWWRGHAVLLPCDR